MCRSVKFLLKHPIKSICKITKDGDEKVDRARAKARAARAS